MKVAIYVQDMRASGVMRTMIAFARFMMQEGGVVTLLAGHAAGHFRPKMSRPPPSPRRATAGRIVRRASLLSRGYGKTCARARPTWCRPEAISDTSACGPHRTG
jgi:hypothetical protein